MQAFKKIQLFHLLLVILNFLYPKSGCQQTPTIFCGKINIRTPFLLQNSSVLNHMILCKSEKLYFRTSIGLYPISSINYTTRLLTISHRSTSSSISHFVSPSKLSAGFPPPPQPNSLILFNCSKQKYPLPPFLHNCGHLKGVQKTNLSSCVLVDDTEKLGVDFHPKDLNCSRYSRVYKSDIEKVELGTRIRFDIPDHVPNVCDECQKPHGNCGVGLRCVCHPRECKDKVTSVGVKMRPFHNIIVSLIYFIAVMDFMKGL